MCRGCDENAVSWVQISLKYTFPCDTDDKQKNILYKMSIKIKKFMNMHLVGNLYNLRNNDAMA